jgi:hypothetical protein
MQRLKLLITYQVYLFVCRVINWLYSLWFRVTKRHSKIDEINDLFNLVDELPYISLLTKFMLTNYQYSDKEKFDLPKHPEWTLHGKIYNCNDFSYALLCFLDKFRPWVDAKLMITYAPNERGHCVCLINTQEGFVHASNYGVVKFFNTIEDVATNLYPNWNFYVICDAKLKLKTIRTN